MAADGSRDGQEMSRRIREELERIRDAEGRVEEALETVRQARRRVEVVARELGREEERVRAWVREEIRAVGGSSGPSVPLLEPPGEPETPTAGDAAARSWRSEPPAGWSTWREPARHTPPGPTAPPTGGATSAAAAPVEDRRPAAPEVDATPELASTAPAPRAVTGATPVSTPAALPPADMLGWRRAGLGAAAALVVGLIGWLAVRGMREDTPPAPVAEAQPTQTAPLTPPAPSPAESTAAAQAAVAGPLALLPADASARQALYDSLFAARSPLFDPLLAQVQGETTDRPLERALGAWRQGPLDAQDADLVHSALLQHVLKAEIDPSIEVDGQVLRNPCRGTSCSALLNAWERKREALGLPAVPASAPTDPRALRTAEAALVLAWLREANGTPTPAP